MDALHAANWQRGRDRTAARPARIPRPGVKDRSVRRLGKPTGMTSEQTREFLRKWGAGELKGQYTESTLDL